MDKHPRILVVEDNDFVRDQLAKFLNEEGYETTQTRDGYEALECLNDEISLALVDLRMQPMNGMDLIGHLKKKERRIPVIVVTGCDTQGLEREPVLWDVGAILRKPVPKDLLVETVTRILGASAQHP